MSREGGGGLGSGGPADRSAQARRGAALGLILLLALALRLWGTGWGLPNSLHYFSYHPDESHILVASTPAMGGLNLFAGKGLPSFYNYGSLQLYLINIAVSFATTYGFIGAVVNKSGAIDPVAWAHAFLIARLLTVLMGVGTVWVVYAIGSRLWNTAAGLLAALFLALMPLAAQHSHFATVDIPCAFWISLSFLWSVRAWQDTAKVNRAFLLAGVFAGLATATKYNSALVFLPVLVAACLRWKAPSPSGRGVPEGRGEGQEGGLKRPEGEETAFKGSGSGNEPGELAPPSRGGKGAGGLGLGVALAGLLLAFLLTCPGAILAHQAFFHDLQTEAVHVSRQGEIYFQQTGIGWVYVIARNLDTGLGLPLLLLCLAGVAYAFWRRQPADWFLLAFTLPYYLVVGAAQSRYARYEIPLLPVLALLAARFVVDFAGAKDPRKPAAIAVGAFVALFTLVDSAFLLRPMAMTDPRDQAAAWIQQNIPPSSPIGFASKPWFWTPPLSPYFSFYAPGQWQSFSPPGQPSRFDYNPAKDYDTAELESLKPPVVVLSEYEYYDWLRVKNPAAVAYIADLKQNYRLVATFSATHPLGGKHEIDGLPIQDLPHDMLYPSPHILVFERR